MAIEICAVGDIMLGEQPLCHKFGVKSIIISRGIDYLFKDIKNIFKDADIVFGNLEAPISNNTVKKGFEAKSFLVDDPNIIEGIKNANFNIISVANNHIMEHGDVAFRSTVDLLQKNNIDVVGCKNKIQILEKNGYKIAFMAYSFIDDFIFDCLYDKIHSEKKIIDDIRVIRNFCDFVIISLHWGYEYVPFPSPKQIKIGRTLVDCGADIILGHHAHIIQGYELYKGKPIIYGLGNFIFDHVYIKSTQKSFIAKIIIERNRLIRFDIIPIICDTKEYFPKVAYGKNKNDIINNISIIRTLIENKDLSDYYNYIGDYSILAKKYRKDAKMQMKIHFIENIYKYSPSVMITILKEYTQRFLSELL